MPRTVTKSLSFPLGGVARAGNYRDQTRPYSSPWAVNVRGVGSLEGRVRGGSRPGLAKFSSTQLVGAITAMVPVVSVNDDGDREYAVVIIADGKFYKLQGDALSSLSSEIAIGAQTITIGGEEIVFPSAVGSASPIGQTDAYAAVSRNGRVLLADSILREYDLQNGSVVAVPASEGIVPENQPVIALYRDRVILTGKDHLWYASRMSDIEDWDFGATMEDGGRAVAGQLSHSGVIGDVPIAAIPFEDKALTFACENSLWVLYGDPATGKLERISGEIGIVSPNAWAMSADGQMAFLSNDGVYLWRVGSQAAPVRFSEARIPWRLREIDPGANIINMAYCPRERGFHLFVTPETGAGLHWWLDPEHKAVWPVVLQADHQPTAVARVNDGGLADVALGCSDGYLRMFREDSVTDDGSPLESHVLIGPVRISANDMKAAVLAEVHAIMSAFIGDVTWRVYMDDSAESVVDRAVQAVEDDISDGAVGGFQATGVWSSGRNKVSRTRVRGSWVVIQITGQLQWSYEAIEIVVRHLGRLR